MSGAAALPAVRTSLVTGATTTDATTTDATTTTTAVLLEGLPDGHTTLTPSAHLLIARIAPGCLCCTGNLVLRVTLNRLLRRRPERLYIGLASTAHLDQLRSWLCTPPYDQLLELTLDLAPGRHP